MNTDKNSDSRKPDFYAYTSGPGENAPLIRIGAAWNVAKGGISITTVATPVDGKFILFPPKDNNQ